MTNERVHHVASPPQHRARSQNCRTVPSPPAVNRVNNECIIGSHAICTKTCAAHPVKKKCSRVFQLNSTRSKVWFLHLWKKPRSGDRHGCVSTDGPASPSFLRFRWRRFVFVMGLLRFSTSPRRLPCDLPSPHALCVADLETELTAPDK